MGPIKRFQARRKAAKQLRVPTQTEVIEATPRDELWKIRTNLHLIQENPKNAELVKAAFGDIKSTVEKINSKSKSEQDRFAVHEVKNPMTALQGWIELGRSEKLAKVADEMEKTLSRFDEPPTLREKTVMGPGFWRNLKADLNVSVKMEAPKKGVMMIDEGRITSVLETLVRNAEEAGAKKVVIRGAPSGNHYKITVENEGAVPKNFLEQMQKFERGFSTKKHLEGGKRGEGLPGAKYMVELHGGRILIESVPRFGNMKKGKTRFVIILPLKK